MVNRVDAMDVFIRLSLEGFLKQVDRLAAMRLNRSDIRVPLDKPRPVRPRLQWEPLALSTKRVGAGAELLHVLADAVKMQHRCGGVMPVLVDEKVHHQVMRLLYSPAYWEWDVPGWLRQVPVLYGTWHAYKQTVMLVYRHFLPVFSALELRSPPTVGGQFKATRKVIFMEKMVASLLLASPSVKQQVEIALVAPRNAASRNQTQLRFFQCNVLKRALQ